MKSTLGVLSLVLVLVLIQAQDQTCNKTLGKEELHQVDGDWVLVWFVYDKTKTHEVDPLPNFTSSHMEIRVQSDNQTVSMLERNVYGGGKCAIYTMNLTLPQSDTQQRRLQMEGAMENKDGEVKPYNDTAEAEFLPSSEHSMTLLYISKKHGTMLIVYRREGHHREVDDQQKEEKRGVARCLGLSGDTFEEWSYDGTADFCHKKSTPEKTES